MKLLKKLTAAILVLSMVPFTAFAGIGRMETTASAASSKSVKGNEKICGLLSAMGIIDNTFEFQYSRKVSRAEFAKMAALAGGYTIEEAEYQGFFPDVAEENEYAAYVEFLHTIGVVNGDGDGNFAPDRIITLTEAVTMLLRVAGYGKLVEAEGGYPEGYMRVARNEGLLKNVSGTSELTGDDALVLIYNMLNMNPIGISSPDKITLDGEETMLSDRHDIYWRKGTVESNSVSSLRAGSEARENCVIIDTGSELIEMSAGKTDIEDKLGYYVTVYYHYDEAADQSECIYYDAESKNNIVSVDFKKIEKITDNTIEYDNGTNTKKLKTANAVVLYNGAYYQGAYITKSSLENLVGTVTAIDNDGDGTYDILSYEAYETYVVGNAVTKDEMIYDKITGKGISVSDEEADKYSIRFADGSDAVFGDICDGVVVSVAKSAEASTVRTVKVIISPKKVSGAFTAIDDDNGTRFVEIDYIDRYDLLDRVSDSDFPIIGGGVTLVLDAFDNVAYVETKYSADLQYGFMYDFKKSIHDDVVTIDMYSAENKLEKYTVSKKVKIDGETYDDPETVKNILSNISKVKVNSDYLPQGAVPIRYRLSENKEIKMIDSPDRGEKEGENTLTFMQTGSNVYSSGTFGYKVPINGDTTILSITTPDRTKIENYRLENAYTFRGSSYFREKIKYTYCAYQVDPKSPYADFVLIMSSYGSVEREDPFYVVSKYNARILDEETGDILIRLDGCSEGKESSYYVQKEYEEKFLALGLKEGDVIRVGVDDQGRLCHVEGPIVSYNPDTKKIEFTNINEGQNTTSKIRESEQSVVAILGDVDTRKEGLIKLYHIPWSTTVSANTNIDNIKSDSSREQFYVNIDGTVPITVYDATEVKDKVFGGTYDDIISMENGFSNHSIVLLRYRSSSLKEVVVLNGLYK